MFNRLLKKIQILPCKFIIIRKKFEQSYASKLIFSKLIFSFNGDIINIIKNRFDNPDREIKTYIKKIVLNEKLKKIKYII